MALLCAPLLAATAAGCGSSVGGGGGGDADAGSGGADAGSGGADAGSGGGAALRWYVTCGDPVCGGHRPNPEVAPCTDQKEGASCVALDAACDPGNDCNSHLLCTTSDPTLAGCPRSRARYKHDIQYLPASELARVHDELVRMPLATWRYNHEGERGREHLGFIIDDDPASPAVAGDGDHVDLYGYTSMAVAAVQVQEKQIAALQQEIAALRRELESMRQAGRSPARPAPKAERRKTGATAP
ncbi:tail fiber domain-containing protein [Sorangium sp. So ce321]|uniref:tail fiber domain-containing protein n=1 Tax=Sorangium sp. So ce321 TaxID=3133300 RepID=UPI003F611D99